MNELIEISDEDDDSYDSIRTRSSMPELGSTETDLDWKENIYNSDIESSSNESDDSDINDLVLNIHNVYDNNNLRFEREIGFKIRAKREKQIPVKLDSNRFVRASNDNIDNKNEKIIIIQTNEDSIQPSILFSNAISL